MFFVIKKQRNSLAQYVIIHSVTHTHTPHTKGERGRVFFHFHIDLKKGLLKRCCRTDGHSIFSERDKREREREKRGVSSKKIQKSHKSFLYCPSTLQKKVREIFNSFSIFFSNCVSSEW